MPKIMTGKNPDRQVEVEECRDPDGKPWTYFRPVTLHGGLPHESSDVALRDRAAAQAWLDDTTD